MTCSNVYFCHHFTSIKLTRHNEGTCNILVTLATDKPSFLSEHKCMSASC